MINETDSKLYKFNRSDRSCWFTGESTDIGGIFSNSINPCDNLSDVEILHQGIDTLKQRYSGTMRADVGSRLALMLKDNWDPVYILQDSSFILSPGSKASRYKYKLHAKALGVLIHVGSYHQDDEGWLQPGKGMIKVELSPKFILSLGYDDLICTVNAYARALMADFIPSGVDVHLCVDVQGWKPDLSLVSDMVTMTKIKPVYHGMNNSEFDANTASLSYGDAESFTFGPASSSQLAIYDKTKESIKKGTHSFWSDVYRENNIAYKENDHVFRTELRLPSVVIKNLVKRTDSDHRHDIISIESLQPHLNSLWKYGLSRLFRYDYPTSPKKTKTVRPIWQLLLDDAYFNESFQPADYKRQYLQVDDSIDTNIKLALGNLTTALAKANVSIEEGIATIQSLPIYKQLLAYVSESKGLDEGHYIQYLADILHTKRIIYSERAAHSELNFKAYRRDYRYTYKDDAYKAY